MALDPMHQFQITKVIPFEPVNIPGLGLVDLSITNSVVAMAAAALLVILVVAFAARGAVVPGRMQAVGEMLYGLVDGLTSSMIGHDGKAFTPYAFTIFTFVLAMNLLGMFLVFTATSQLAVTVTLACLSIGTVIIVGFARNGLGFFKLFMPSGVPLFILPILIPIEIISFLVRPVTLALRLFGNMVGGHVVMKVFAGFVIGLGGMAASGGLGFLGIPGAAVVFSGVVALTALEFMVSILQAFVFTALTCVYLNDVVNLHHH